MSTSANSSAPNGSNIVTSSLFGLKEIGSSDDEPDASSIQKTAAATFDHTEEKPVRRDFMAPPEYDDSDADDDDDDDDQPAQAFMQNRELSWLTFNERVLDQGADESVPLLERLNFISIFWSNLQEFFMVRVGSLTDLSYIKPPLHDSKTGMTPKEQIRKIHERCAELYPIQESYYEHVRGSLAKEGVRHLRPDDLSDEQRNYLAGLVRHNIAPLLSPQIINSRHPFPHLENGKLYILVRLDDEADAKPRKKKDKTGKKNKGAEGVVLGLIPLPHQIDRLIRVPGRGYQFILLEHAIEMFADEIFSMYTIKHTNVICVTRNADMDANQGDDASDEDYREHMKRLLKQRARLAPVRLECERPLSPVMEKLMLKKLGLKRYQVYDTRVPLDLSFTWGLGSKLSESKRAALTNPPFTPAWPACFDRTRRIIDQVQEKEVLLSYPYESMDPFVQLLREAANDPAVISIKITLYRLASQSHLAEALIAAAENGKQVTALFELRARFDESNNIEWSQRFEQAGCNVIYGFRDYKVHSKICCITRRTEDGIQHITQLGTGNYNEKTAKLYTDLSFITTDETFGRDATEFFKNMQLENTSDDYDTLCVAPLQIKTALLANIDEEIAKARAGEPAAVFMKANSVTDKDVIEKIAEASQAGVRVTLFIRGICCIVPGLKGITENVRVVSIVGRLLEHSRIYCFGTGADRRIYLSSADLMTRNLDKRIEIAWPILDEGIKDRILNYLDICMRDTAKLRQLRPNLTYTPLGSFCEVDEEGNALPSFDAQNALIEIAAVNAREAQEPRARVQAACDEEAAQEPTHEDEAFVAASAAEAATQDASAAEPIPEASPAPAREPEILAEADSAPEAEAEAEAEPEAEPHAQPVTEPQAESEPHAQTETAPETETEQQSQPVTEPQAEVVPVPNAGEKPDETLAPNRETEPQAEQASEREPVLRPEGETENEPLDVPADAPVLLSEPESDPKLEPEPEPGPKPVFEPRYDTPSSDEPSLTDFTVDEILAVESPLDAGASHVDEPKVQAESSYVPTAESQELAEMNVDDILAGHNQLDSAQPEQVQAAKAQTQANSQDAAGEAPDVQDEAADGERPSTENRHVFGNPFAQAHRDRADEEEARSFFEEPTREVEIPPEKKGFFSRLFNR